MQILEERPPATTTPQAISSWSCTPHRRSARFHIRFDDFIDISRSSAPDDDAHTLLLFESMARANADALRVFENKTNQRIKWLWKEYSIDYGSLPHQDDLWIEVSTRDLEALSLHAYSKSTYAKCLLDQTCEDEPMSLLELGYLRRRFIARPGGGPTMRPATTVYLDERGEPFILVDKQGFYVDSEGGEHSAISEGYTLIIWQYLYCSEAVNAAIAVLDDEEPPSAVPRWPRVAIREKPRPGKSGQKRGAQAHETTKSSDASDAPAENNSMHASAVQGGTKKAVSPIDPFAYQNNTDGAVTQTAQCSPRLLRSDPESLRSAQWSAETLIALTAQILEVPDPAQCDAHIWEREWAVPAQQILALPDLQGIEPRNAWEKVQRHILGMTDLSSPSWWVRGRARLTRISLRNVIGENASNWRVVGAELDNAGWYSQLLVPYDGPPFDDFPENAQSYAHGLTANVIAVTELRNDEGGCEVVAQPPPDDEAEEDYAPRWQGMSRDEANELAWQIRQVYPTIKTGLRDDPGGTVVGINYAPDQWYNFVFPSDWYACSRETQYYLDLAVDYATAQRRTRPPGK